MEDEFDPGEVVLRKAKDAINNKYQADIGLDLPSNDTSKKVKWSDSTDLREKMKEYRRSQLSICLDYQHIAVEEEREREGVRRWREIKDKVEEEDDEDTANNEDPPTEVPTETAPEESDDDGDDSESDGDPYCDEALEAKLRVIKAKASRHTILPAYTAAVTVYEDWFVSNSSGSSLSPEQRTQMSTQLGLYKEIVDLYNSWADGDDVDKIDAAYQAIMRKLMESKKVDAPQVVTDAMTSTMQDEANVKKHKDVYSSMVDDMVTDLSKQIQTTTV